MRTGKWMALAAVGLGAAAAGTVLFGRRAQCGMGSRKGGKHLIRKAISIASEQSAVYSLWREPSTHARIRGFEVTATSDERWHWRREAEGGQVAEWDTIFTLEQPPERLEWRSENGGPRWGVFHKGVLELRSTPDGQGTELRLSLELSLAQNLVGIRPRIEYGVSRALYRFRQLAETGELATTKGQSASRQVPAPGAKAA